MYNWYSKRLYFVWRTKTLSTFEVAKKSFIISSKASFNIQIFEVWQLLKLVLFEWTVNVWNARLHYDIHVYTRVWETRTQTPQSWLHYVTWSILFLHNRGFKGHSRHEIDQAFPFCYCILQAIKNWMVGRPGNEARLKPTEIIPGPSRFNSKTQIPVRLRQYCSMPSTFLPRDLSNLVVRPSY